MAESSFGGFASGLFQGVKAVDEHKRAKRVNSLLAREADKYDLDRKGLAGEYDARGGNVSDIPQFQDDPEPFISRFFNWAKGGFGKDATQAASDGDIYGVTDGNDPGAMGPPAAQAIQTRPTMGPQQFADGGRVDEARMKRSYGEHYLTEEEANQDVPVVGSMTDSKRKRGVPGRQAIPTSGGGLGEFGKDLARSAASYFDDTIKGGTEAGALMDEGNQNIRDAKGARQTGNAIREGASLGLTGAMETTAGLAKDVLVDNPVTQGVLGFLGWDGEEKSRATRDRESAAGESVPADKQAAVQAIDTGPTSEQQAQAAISNAVQQNPGHPDNPGQKIDWAEVAAEGQVAPDDIPHVGVKDWKEYRKKYVLARILRGDSTADAEAQVTKMQQEGMMTNLQQAAFLLQAGDPKAAALAARAAYQYFPNGTDVRFGIMKGVEGKPVLVGTGYSEETGEPVGKGTPQVLTPEYLNAMASNFSNPNAFNAWRADKDKAEFANQKYNEIEKPAAQADLTYKDRAGRAALKNADTAAAKAASAASGSGGLKQTDYDRAYDRFMTSQELTSLEDPDTANYLADVMSRIYQKNPGNYPAVIRFVMQSYNDGTLDQELADIGIE